MKKEEKKLTQEREKRLRELTERSLKILLSPKEDFENKSRKELESMQKDINSLIETLRGYNELLKDIKEFKILWDCIKNKGDYLTVFKIYIAKIHGANMPGGEDSIPF